jgi:peroxiredoxin
LRLARSVSVCLALLLIGCAEQNPKIGNGDRIPAFTLPRLEGDPLSVPSDVNGSILAIRFWADWCHFCESDMAGMETVFRDYRKQGLRVLAVNVGQPRKTVQRFVDRLGLTYEILLDQNGAVSRSYGVIGLPATFLVDRQGRIVTRILGESKPEVLEGLVQGLL